jgi:SAM-dependent methyltransferase
LEWVEDLLGRLPESPDILELGCGRAEEPTLRMAARGRLTGIDISKEQLRRARERCSGANFVHADATTIELAPGSFDAVVSLYAFNHVPRAELPPLVQRIAGWLRRGGHAVLTFGMSDSESIQDDWLGVPMFFASYTPDENRALVEKAGLEIVRDEAVTIIEPEEGEACFQWLLAARSESGREPVGRRRAAAARRRPGARRTREPGATGAPVASLSLGGRTPRRVRARQGR